MDVGDQRLIEADTYLSVSSDVTVTPVSQLAPIEIGSNKYLECFHRTSPTNFFSFHSKSWCPTLYQNDLFSCSCKSSSCLSHGHHSKVNSPYAFPLHIVLKPQGSPVRVSFDPCLLCVPPISKTCANSFFYRSFVYASPTLWNALDLDIRLLPFDAFKKKN